MEGNLVMLLLRIVKYSMVLCMVSTVVFAQAGSPEHASPPDSTLAKNEVITFCNYWKTPQLDSMRAMLGENTRADSQFLQTYGLAGKGPGKVVNFSIVGAAQDEKGMKVRVKLTFKKQAPPHNMNGKHGFYLMKDNQDWKISTIVPPIPLPQVKEGSGGHPGE
jgi:hypothetical protein